MATPSPVKRPSLVAWIGFSLVVVLTVLFLKIVFFNVVSHSSTASSGVAMMQGAVYGYDAGGAPSPTAMPPFASGELALRDKTVMMPIQPGGSAASDLNGNPITPKVIKTGELTLRVSDAPSALDQIRSLVTGANGFIESSSMNDSGEGPRSAYITVRIPVDKLEATTSEIKKLATLVLTENIHGQDVTSQFVDMDADLRNAQAEETLYLDILKKSGSIEDTLAVTQRLNEVRGRIERLQGQKRYLENRTDLATLSITVTEDTRIEAPSRTWKPFEVLRSTVQDLIVSLQELVNFMIRLAIGIVGLLLPIALFTALVIWIGWKIVRAFLRRLNKK